MFYKIEDITTKERFNATIVNNIIKIYSNKDYSGKSDTIISIDNFKKKYKIIKEIKD